MSKKSPESVQVRAKDLLPPTADELRRLRDGRFRSPDLSAIPELSAAQIKAAARARPGKTRITIFLDADLVAFFRSRGPGYQTKINQALRQHVREQQMKAEPASLIDQTVALLERLKVQVHAKPAKRPKSKLPSRGLNTARGRLLRSR